MVLAVLVVVLGVYVVILGGSGGGPMCFCGGSGGESRPDMEEL